jgi:benzoate-CoA ligase family protein
VALRLPRASNIAEEFLDRPAREHPARIAIRGEPRALAYGELAELANRAGSALAAAGVARGDRVLIALPDSPEFVAAFFGAAKIGAVAVPVNPFTRRADYATYLADAAPRVAVVHTETLEEFLPACGPEPASRPAAEHTPFGGRRPAAALHPPDLLVVVPQAPSAPAPSLPWLACPLRGWEESLAQAAPRLAAAPTAATDPAFLLYTSGSSGTPKAALHQHKDMLVTSRSYAQGVLGLRPDDCAFSVSKLFFAYGLGNAMYFPFSVGAATLLYPGRPRPQAVAEMVARRRPTVFYAVPTFYAALLRAVEEGLPADFSSVRLAVSAGEALPGEIFLQFRRRFGLEILDGIGSTEMLHMFLSNRPGEARPGTCGVEVPHVDARIVDDAGRPVPPKEIGNLWVRGQSAFAGYWRKPELTAQTCREGWVVTGDKFFRDDDGYYHYCGRTDDMMKVAGMWVAPGEVENALLAHHAVAEAAVVGWERSGFVRPVACVVLRAGFAAGAPLAEELREFVGSRLASYKVPREIRFLDELPKTATGKIQRFKLRP